MQQDQRLGLIVNASAGRVRRHFLKQDRFWERLLPANRVALTRNPAELSPALARLRAEGADIIALLGGDGSLHRLATCLIQNSGGAEKVALLPLAGGTLNGLARALGTGGPPEATLRQVLVRSGSAPLAIRHLRPLLIEDVGQGLRLAGFTLAAGMPVEAVCRYEQAAGRGVTAVARICVTTAARLLVTRRRRAAALRICGTLAMPVAHTLVAGVVERPFLWFRPFGTLRSAEPGFHVVGLDMPLPLVALQLWPICRGNRDLPGRSLAAMERLQISGGSGYVIDGEIHGEGVPCDLRLSLGPALAFVAPGRVPVSMNKHDASCPALNLPFPRGYGIDKCACLA